MQDPDGVTTIMEQSIYGTPSTIILPKSLTTIEYGTFYSYEVPNITIPENVTQMPASMFRNSNCKLSPGYKNYVIEDDIVYNSDKTEL